MEGDKRGWFEHRRALLLTQFGFSVASINYRFAPKHIYPAQYEDAVCALRWLRENGSSRGIDTSFVGLMGDSAGGHLVSVIGTLGVKTAHRVDAVAAFYAPFDLVNMEPQSLLAKAIQPALPTPELRHRWSPILHVGAETPPFLIVHGKNDKIISVAQSVRFAMLLKDAGHNPLLVAVENARHGLVPLGVEPDPNQATIDKLFVAFFLNASGFRGE